MHNRGHVNWFARLLNTFCIIDKTFPSDIIYKRIKSSFEKASLNEMSKSHKNMRKKKKLNLKGKKKNVWTKNIHQQKRIVNLSNKNTLAEHVYSLIPKEIWKIFESVFERPMKLMHCLKIFKIGAVVSKQISIKWSLLWPHWIVTDFLARICQTEKFIWIKI